MLQVSEILPGLYLRGRFNRHWTQEHLLSELKERGIKNVVSVYPKGEPLLLHQSEVRYRHNPFLDNTRDMVQKDVTYLGRDVAACVQANSPTLVMCKRGRNRSGLVVAFAVMRLLNCSPDEAITHVRSKRVMHPPVLSNQVFIDFLYKHSEEG